MIFGLYRYDASIKRVAIAGDDGHDGTSVHGQPLKRPRVPVTVQQHVQRWHPRMSAATYRRLERRR